MTVGAKPKTRKDLRQTNVRLDPDVVDRLNLHCDIHPLRPRRDSVINVAIRQYLEREDAAEQGRNRVVVSP